ncbi:MAG TPA: anhydro-N-acetylmuramic acid kinase [Bacteroidia bacterium]|jgi:anhydro-N-acetylmuramic acid kinase|nr:anhydro-N-acetylmuramic acid kinase [Bacteroidia bacterium]
MNTYTAIGLMSGTSLDGLDIACCTFIYQRGKWRFHISSAKTIAYTPVLKDRLRNADKLDAAGLAEIHTWFGHWMGTRADDFIRKHKLKPLIVSSHGHTVFHQPAKGFTLQIGSGASLAAACGIKTVCDFRSGDVALGGQGAPLVPIGDELLFSEYGYCLNLGGFANISFRDQNERVAFDICPVNIVLNHLTLKLGKAFDKGGALARKGTLILPLLEALNEARFYQKKGPKSLGKEWVWKEVIPLLEKQKASVPDLLHTYCEHIAYQIGIQILPGKNDMLVTGGGAYNDFLMERIRDYAPCEIRIPDNLTVQFREALVFAFLGVLRLRGEHNCLSSVTGARCDSSGGCIYDPLL